MSAAEVRRVSTAPGVLGGAVVVLGLALLLARLFVLSSGARAPALAAVLGAVGIASIAVPVAASRAHLPAWIALGLGVGVVLLAAAAAGAPVPLALGTWSIPLAMLAAVGEEAFFRRLMYGRLEPHGPIIAVGATALAFALVHLPLYGVVALPVDVAAGLLLGWQRWATGSWTVPAATHAWANLVMMLR